MVVSSMIKYAALAAAGALSVTGAAWAVINPAPARPAEAEAPLRGLQGYDPVAEAPAVPKSNDGHFWADGRVNGADVRFLVDTGASEVFLTLADARRLGIDPDQLVYDRKVRTADGESFAAPVRLTSVSIQGVRLTQVDALVIGRGLPASLLGMSYLGRLSRFEATPNALVLEP